MSVTLRNTTIYLNTAITGILWYGYYLLHTSLDRKEEMTNSSRLLVMDTANEHALCIYAIISAVVTVRPLTSLFC